MGSYQKAPQKGITKLQYFFRGSFVLLLFQLTIKYEGAGFAISYFLFLDKI